MNNTENLLNDELQVDTVVQHHLAGTARWARFLAIVGFIFSGLFLLTTLFNKINYNDPYSKNTYRPGTNPDVNPVFTIIFLLVITLTLFFTSLFTYRFATRMKKALQNTDQFVFIDAVANLAKNYKFLGIVTIIYLVIILLASLFAAFLMSSTGI